MRVRLPGHASVSIALVALLLAAGCGPDHTPTANTPTTPDLASGGTQGPDLRAAIAAKDKYASNLLRQPGVEGVAVTLTTGNRPAVVIFTSRAAMAGLPHQLDSIPVVQNLSGPFSAILPHAKPNRKGGKGGGSADPTSRFTRPVPIGVSIGNWNECAAGTLGARVKAGGNLYVLSNNHVLARENAASLGEDILQPGRYDTQCSASASDVIADLSKFKPISFTSDNTVDVAIALARPGAVDNKTYSGGYGTPNSTTTSAYIGQVVQKCGRTTGCNTGTVAAVNGTYRIQYSSGIATFVNQIAISGSHGPFSRAGDSGSLIVTNNASANPVGLLFAGSSTITIANPIGPALQAMGVTIDGK